MSKSRLAILSFLFFAFTHMSNCQVTVAESLDSLQAQPTKYLTPMEYAFMFHEETPWMFKGRINSNSIDIAFEKRIKRALTANFSLSSYDSQGLGLNISSRYYYNMESRQENKNIPFNLSGNYLEAGIRLTNEETNYIKDTFYIDNEFFSVTTFSSQQELNSTFFVKWGMQRRYLKHGFFDLGLKASYRLGTNFYSGFQLNSETYLGLAFARDKSSLKKDALCNVIRCFEAEKSAWKGSVSNLLNIQVNDYEKSFRLNPEIGYEVKLGNSSFSINNDLNVEIGIYQFSNRYPSVSGNNRLIYGFEYAVETRYYYNLRNRILKGKSGNGLSANYFSIGMYNKYSKFISDSDLLLNNSAYGYLQPQISIGFQRFVGDHFFYDIAFGYRPTDLAIIKSKSYDYIAQTYLISKIGYRF